MDFLQITAQFTEARRAGVNNFTLGDFGAVVSTDDGYGYFVVASDGERIAANVSAFYAIRAVCEYDAQRSKEG